MLYFTVVYTCQFKANLDQQDGSVNEKVPAFKPKDPGFKFKLLDPQGSPKGDCFYLCQKKIRGRERKTVAHTESPRCELGVERASLRASQLHSRGFHTR